MSDVIDLFDNPYVVAPVGGKLLRAQAKGKHVIIVDKLGYTTRRGDGRWVSHRVQVIELSEPATAMGDDAVCVRNARYEWWSRRELRKAGAFDKSVTLFDVFLIL